MPRHIRILFFLTFFATLTVGRDGGGQGRGTSPQSEGMLAIIAALSDALSAGEPSSLFLFLFLLLFLLLLLHFLLKPPRPYPPFAYTPSYIPLPPSTMHHAPLTHTLTETHTHHVRGLTTRRKRRGIGQASGGRHAIGPRGSMSCLWTDPFTPEPHGINWHDRHDSSPV